METISINIYYRQTAQYDGDETPPSYQGEIALSSCSPFVPTICFTSGERMLKDNVPVDFMYSLQIRDSFPIRRRVGFFTEVFKTLYSTSGQIRVITATLDPETSFLVEPGAILALRGGAVTPLLLLCVKSSELFNLAESPEQDASKFCLVVNRELLTNESYYRVYRNINKNIIEHYAEKIDVVYTNHILNRCFGTLALPKPNIRSLREMPRISAELTELACAEQ